MLDPIFAANYVLDSLRINDPSDLQLLELIAYERGAVVNEESLDGAEARLVVIGKKAVITVSSNIENLHRKRFSIAHELGHFELHHMLKPLEVCESKDIDDWTLRNQHPSKEVEANEFAGALLLPERFFSSLCEQEDPSIKYISELANQFSVSLTATAIRYAHFCSEPLAIILSREGYVQWYRASDEFDNLGLRVEVGKQLDPITGASSFFTKGYISSKSKAVHARAWLKPGGYHAEATLQEQSIAMSRYGMVLTLLWVDEELDDEDELDW